jgi:hypothetical protein
VLRLSFWNFSSPFIALSGVPRGSVLGPSLFNTYIKDLSNKITYCNFLLFADDIKILHRITSIDYCFLLRSDINSVQNWCIANHIKINAGKTSVISFFRKTNMFTFNYVIYNSYSATDCTVQNEVIDC